MALVPFCRTTSATCSLPLSSFSPALACRRMPTFCARPMVANSAGTVRACTPLKVKRALFLGGGIAVGQDDVDLGRRRTITDPLELVRWNLAQGHSLCQGSLRRYRKRRTRLSPIKRTVPGLPLAGVAALAKATRLMATVAAVTATIFFIYSIS